MASPYMKIIGNYTFRMILNQQTPDFYGEGHQEFYACFAVRYLEGERR